MKHSRERLRIAMLAKMPARPAPQPPGAAAKALERFKDAVPGAENVIEVAQNHRKALIAGGVMLAIFIARPWRLLFRPQVLFALGTSLAGFGIKRVPTRTWLKLVRWVAAMAPRSAPPPQARHVPAVIRPGPR